MAFGVSMNTRRGLRAFRVIALGTVLGLGSLVASPSASPVGGFTRLDADGVFGLPDVGAGKKVMAHPESSWEVWFEDLFGLGDADFNDLVLRVDFGEAGHGNDDVVGTVSYIGGLSAHQHSVTVEGLTVGGPSYFGQFTIKKNAEAVFKLNDLTSGDSFFSGPGNRNGDGNYHAIVRSVAYQPPVSDTPEPATMALMGLGLGGIVLARKKLT